jgi:hypothetical protein
MAERYNLSRTMDILRQRDIKIHVERQHKASKTIVEAGIAAKAIDAIDNQNELPASEVSAQVRDFRDSGPIY